MQVSDDVPNEVASYVSGRRDASDITVPPGELIDVSISAVSSWAGSGLDVGSWTAAAARWQMDERDGGEKRANIKPQVPRLLRSVLLAARAESGSAGRTLVLQPYG